MSYYIILALPLTVALIPFILLVRKGFKKIILIVSILVGLLTCILKANSGSPIEYVLLDGIISFLIWYIILDIVYRIAYRFKNRNKV